MSQPQCVIETGSLRAALLAVLDFASKDKTRGHLECVLLEVSALKFRVVATDGHTLAMVKGVCKGNGGTQGTVRLLLTRDAIKPFAAWLKSVSALCDVTLSVESPTLLRASTEADVPHFVALRVGDEFPPYEQVIPLDPEATTGHVGLSAAYLERVGKAAQQLGGTKAFATSLRMVPGKDDLTPVKWDARCDSLLLEAIFVVMPVRLGAKAPVAWDSDRWPDRRDVPATSKRERAA